MKQINGIGSSAVTNAPLARTDRQAATTTTATNAAATQTASADSAQLSTTAVLIQQNAGADDVRYEKVAAIKSAIDAGTYNVSASPVADKLIEFMS